MKEAIVSPDLAVEIKDSPIPEPGPNEVLIKVIVSGSNPKDWKVPQWMKSTHNSGDDVAGTVEKVGSKVYEFKPGDRVAAFHVMRAPHGSFAEYSISPAHTAFHIPQELSYEEAATLPLAAMTAAIGLFIRLGLPEPWSGRQDGFVDKEKGEKTARGTPLVIYGAASAVGAYAVQLAKKASIGPLICVAGRGIPFVEKLLDKSVGDVVIDYRKGDEAIVKGIKDAVDAHGGTLEYAFDAVSEHGSYQNISKVLSQKGGKITLVLPGKDYSEIPKGIEQSLTMVGDAHSAQTDFAFAFYRLLAKWIHDGSFQPHPHEVVPGGLNGVKQGLLNLKDGKASAVKYVFRIADTPGVAS